LHSDEVQKGIMPVPTLIMIVSFDLFLQHLLWRLLWHYTTYYASKSTVLLCLFFRWVW